MIVVVLPCEREQVVEQVRSHVKLGQEQGFLGWKRQAVPQWVPESFSQVQRFGVRDARHLWLIRDV